MSVAAWRHDRFAVRALVLLAAYSGLRAGELAALRRKHVDLLHRMVTVVEQPPGEVETWLDLPTSSGHPAVVIVNPDDDVTPEALAARLDEIEGEEPLDLPVTAAAPLAAARAAGEV